MVEIAIIVGAYSYVILALGLMHILYFPPVLVVTIVFFLISLRIIVKAYQTNIKTKPLSFMGKEWILISILTILTAINLLGALGPELAFDSLWYHLTIPGLYAKSHEIYYIKGNLLYYNLMPRLTEMLYTVSIILQDEIAAKVIHFLFGLGTTIVLYNISRVFLNKFHSLLAVVIYYSNLVVAWVSITAYTDLSRSFYELMSIYMFILYLKIKRTVFFVLSSVFLGLAISSKVLSIGTLGIFIFILLILLVKRKVSASKITIFVSISSMVALPWFVIAYLNSGNPFFPLFTHLGVRNFTPELLNPILFIKTVITVFLMNPDPVNPLYLCFMPLVLTILFKKGLILKILAFFSLMYFLIWYFLAQSGGSRFLITLFAILSLLIVFMTKKTGIEFYSRLLFIATCFVGIISIVYRGAANSRYIPYILGLESKQEFLMNNLNFNFGDFYDENGEIKKIVGKKLVVVENIHNLYYADFNYILKEWETQKNAEYMLVGGKNSYSYKKLYENKKTNVTLYQL